MERVPLKLKAIMFSGFGGDVPRYVQANSGPVTPYSKTRLLAFQFENIALHDHFTSAPRALK